MTKREFIEGIERVRNNEKLLNHDVGLCGAIEDYFNFPVNNRVRWYFQYLFSNDLVYYWGYPSNKYPERLEQRLMALDVFEQNVLCYGTYKEW